MTEFPQRLRHQIPGWVGRGAIYHIRIRTGEDNSVPLTEPLVGHALLKGARHYHQAQRWHARCLLLMPDHLHALVSFFDDSSMGATVGAWKAYHARRHGIIWQDGFFDHRIRNAQSLGLKADYIRRNPVVKGLCTRDTDWAWAIWMTD
ncbi:MAG TPA: hypothetical protein VGM73_10020 [Candidatus Didemnitutus sp.]|jgi:REP element-mobilizing transposase RayT